MRIIKLLVLLNLCSVLGIQAQNYTISGYIRDSDTKESLIGSSLYEINTRKGTSSNAYGFYSITLPAGNVSLVCSYIGYERKELMFNLQNDTIIPLFLSYDTNLLSEIVVKASEDKHNDARLGTLNISISQIKNTPALLGESDLMKSLQFVPGVQSTSEGKSDLSVRGGSPDQNLILLDGIPLYNVNHVFGFLSVFNTDALKNVTLYKSGFPARFGGRLSSVIDIHTKDGNKEKFAGSATLGLLALKANLEGPIVKDRTSFTFSLRRSYMDLFMGKVQDWIDNDKSNKNKFFFYDINAKVHHKVSDKTSLYLMVYNGKDKLDDKASTKADKKELSTQNWAWGNTIVATRINQVVAKNLFLNATLSYNYYHYQTLIDKVYRMTSEDNVIKMSRNHLDYNSGIKDYSAVFNFDYMPHSRHYIRFGSSFIYHDFRPEAIVSKFSENEGGKSGLPSKSTYAKEFSIYGEDDWDITDKLKLNAGVRYSLFNVNSKTYASIDPRLALRYRMTSNFSIRAGYTRMKQFIHLLSNNSLFLQTDLWVPATDNIRPMDSDQYAIGFLYTLPLGFDFSVEAYYKNMNNVIEYRDGASFSGVSTGWEQKVEAGKGRAYGIEFSLEKTQGNTTGIISYTLAKTERRFDDINYGEWFPAKYDRRHNVNINIAHKLNEKWDLFANWTFASGDMITIPLLTAEIADIPGEPNDIGLSLLTQLTHRNNYRMGAHHRLDIGVNYTRKKRIDRYGVWNFSIYNLYNRMNPFQLYVDPIENPADNTRFNFKIKQSTLFPIIPSVSYTYNF